MSMNLSVFRSTCICVHVRVRISRHVFEIRVLPVVKMRRFNLLDVHIRIVDMSMVVTVCWVWCLDLVSRFIRKCV